MASHTKSITVKLGFGSAADAPPLRIDVDSTGNDTIYGVKSKIAAAAGGAIKAEDLLLVFGPSDRKLGAQYVGDATVDEKKLALASFSILAWMERFPHWSLTVRLLPETPPPPGVAIQEAAAAAEQKNVAEAVLDARARGDIPKISELPRPWGPLEPVTVPRGELVSGGYLPPVYPDGFSPLVDARG